DSEFHVAGAAGRKSYGVWRRQPDAQLLLCERGSGWHSAPGAIRRARTRECWQSHRIHHSGVRAASDCYDAVDEPDQVRSAAAGRSKAAVSGYFESEAAAGMGTESRVGERAAAFAGIFSPGRGGEGATGLAALFVARWTGGENREQAHDFFALDRIAEHEAHAHAEPGMGGQHLTLDSQLRVGGADQNLHARPPGERGGHFDVATALADIGQGAAIGDAVAETIDFGSEFAGEAQLSAAVAGVGDERGIFYLGRFLALGARVCRWLRGHSASRKASTVLEPARDEAARRLRHVEKTNPGAPARVLPRNIPRQADQLLLAGKSELEINLACGWNPAGSDERGSAVAKVGQSGVQFGRSRIGNVGS